jgi:phosphate transport system protein
MLADSRAISRAIHLILISRHLERVADHATNIAEEAYYMAEGRTLKHHAAEQPDS